MPGPCMKTWPFYQIRWAVYNNWPQFCCRIIWLMRPVQSIVRHAGAVCHWRCVCLLRLKIVPNHCVNIELVCVHLLSWLVLYSILSQILYHILLNFHNNVRQNAVPIVAICSARIYPKANTHFYSHQPINPVFIIISLSDWWWMFYMTYSNLYTWVMNCRM